MTAKNYTLDGVKNAVSVGIQPNEVAAFSFERGMFEQDSKISIVFKKGFEATFFGFEAVGLKFILEEAFSSKEEPLIR